jgi:hypothetical protein
MSSISRGKGRVDFDEEGRKLMSALGIDSSVTDPEGHMSPIWRHPSGGGTVYVGNVYVAQDIGILKRFNVTGVVNCTQGHGALPNFCENKPGGPAYYVFPVSSYWNQIDASHASVHKFTDPLFEFITRHVAGGGNVLVHCLAGAHRAGTTGVAVLMHFAGMDRVTATKTAKSLRPIIDPIGQLPVFLERLQLAQADRAGGAGAGAGAGR